ncbi:hypothetical protein Tco_0945598, partial [Tanacetum coccineum]
MANLDFFDKHNMVAFLKKLEGSEGFHQIVNFLNSTHIMYALIENPTIYVSLIHQFWQTASASTFENREMEITATIDGRVKTVTEASIRRHLKLEDSDGICTLPNTEIFEQLALMGISKGYNGVDIPLFPTMLVHGPNFQGEGSTVLVNIAHPKSIVFSAKPISHFSKLAQSTTRRPYQSKTVLTNKKFTQTNNTTMAKAINTARPKAVNTARPHSVVVNAIRVNQ